MVAEFGSPWQEIGRKAMQPIVRFEHGRKWLTNNAVFLNPNLKELVLEVLKESENTSCDDTLSGLRLDG